MGVVFAPASVLAVRAVGLTGIAVSLLAGFAGERVSAFRPSSGCAVSVRLRAWVIICSDRSGSSTARAMEIAPDEDAEGEDRFA